MGFVMPHVIILAGLGVMGLAFFLQIVGLATPGWSVTGTGESSMETGLFKFCRQGECEEIEVVPGAIKACRAFGILAVLAIAVCLLSGVLICFMSEQKIFTLIAPIAAAVGAFCVMIEFSAYADEYSDYSDNFGYSFTITIFTFILCGVATAILFIGRNKSAA